MKVKATYIVKGIHGKETLLFETDGGKFYILQNGAFGENDMSLFEITEKRADSLLSFMR